MDGLGYNIPCLSEKGKNGRLTLNGLPLKKLNQDFPLEPKEKISIFIGAYGSGKSEVAVNFALMLASRRTEDFMADTSGIILADLDVINPFFRSADAKKVLNDQGISVISPQFANTNADAPSIPGEIYSVFDQPGVHAVLDIGGEDMGARVVSSLKSRIVAMPYAVYMVVNMNRPFTDTKEKIIQMLRELETAAGLMVDGLVNNTNLLSFTDSRELLDANALLKSIQDSTGIPLCFAAGMDRDYPEEWGNRLPDSTSFLRLTRTISYEESDEMDPF